MNHCLAKHQGIREFLHKLVLTWGEGTALWHAQCTLEYEALTAGSGACGWAAITYSSTDGIGKTTFHAKTPM